MSLVSELKRRRVLPLMGVYLGTCWVALEFCNFVAERYHLSQAWVDALLVLAFALIPGMLMFAYNHGAPGRDRWTRLERVFLPCNLLVALGAAALAMGDRPLSAMAQTVERTDEQGNTYVSTIARQDFRRRVLLFPFDHADEPRLRAAAFGLTELLQTSLRSDAFIEADTVLDEYGVLGRLRRSGIQDGAHAPLPLQRRVAETQNFDYLVRGELRSGAAGWSALVQLERVSQAETVLRVDLQSPHLTDLADRAQQALAAALSESIGAPPARAPAPLAEQYGSDEEVLIALFGATIASLIDNDQLEAARRIDAALAKDPGNARALQRAAMIELASGRRDEAIAHLSAALKHDYRLDDRTRFRIRALRHGLSEEHERRRSVLQLWTELYPSSTEARLNLAAAMLWSGQDIPGAIAVYEQILQMAPGLSWIHATLADLYLTQDRIDLARAAARSYAEAEPERAAGQLGLARLAMQASDWEAARPAIDRAALLEPELVGPLLLEAELEVMQGQFDAGERAIERALATVRELGQEVEVRCRHAVLLQFQQRFAEALVQADRCAELGRAAFPPVQWVMDLQLPFSGLRARINGLPATLTAIDAELAGFDQSFRDIGCYGRMLASLEGGDGDLARQELVLFERVMVGSNRSDLDFFTAYGRGRLAWLEGDAQAAASALAESLALFQRSLHAGKGAQRFLDIHLSSLELRLRALIQTGADAAAIELASAAIKRFPGSAPLQTAAAEALLAGGRIEAARAALADARRLWANADPDAVPTDRLQGLQAALAG